MPATTELDALRERTILASLAGRRSSRPGRTSCSGRRRHRWRSRWDNASATVPAPDPDPLLPLALQLLFVQIVAFPAILRPVLLLGAFAVRAHARRVAQVSPLLAAR